MAHASQVMPARILIVEDDNDIRESVAGLLEDEAFATCVARDGADALAILRSDPSFDLILLDLMLPNVDGWEFRVAQRAEPLLSEIPVIAMSASTSAQAKAVDAD